MSRQFASQYKEIPQDYYFLQQFVKCSAMKVHEFSAEPPLKNELRLALAEKLASHNGAFEPTQVEWFTN